MYYKLWLVLGCAIAFQAQCDEQQVCLAEAQSQAEMNQCNGSHLQTVKLQLKHVLAKIKARYQSQDPEFLEKLVLSQQAWQKSLAADLAMKYPQTNKQLAYGSVYPMCASAFEASLITKRITFLQQWLKGSVEGEVCAGSVARR